MKSKVKVRTQKTMAVEVIYYNCQQCGNPLFHPLDRRAGICEGCKLKKLQAKRRREYAKAKAAGEKWTSKSLSDKEIAKRIERIVQKAEGGKRKAEGSAANVFSIAPRPLFVQARRARKVG